MSNNEHADSSKAMNPESANTVIRYKRPPVIERVLSVTANITQETFFSRFEGWKAIIQDHFPDYDPVKDWRLHIKSHEGMPVLTDQQPELVITHRFWRRTKQGKRYFSMRLLPSELTLNLHPESENPHSFEELNAELASWLPQWMSHFDVQECSSVRLGYINMISNATTPQFVDQTGRVQVGRVLRVFAGVPSPNLGIIPPYDCQMGLLIDAERPAVFALRVFGVMEPRDRSSAVRVDFQASVVKSNPCLTAPRVLSDAAFLHTVIRDQFEALFTDEAKESFEPVKS